VASRFVFLVNAAAGTGLAPRRLQRVLERFPAIAAASRMVATASPAALSDALRLADDEIPVAVGGDGSVNALVTLLDRRDELARPIGIVPFGTGNATAHTLGLHSVADAMEALAAQHVRQLDVMRTGLPETPIALVSCSTGFESAFLARYSALRYRSRQYAGWSALVLNATTKMRGVSLTLNGTRWLSPDDIVHNVGLYNIPDYAFGKVMWRGMRADDGIALAAAVTSPVWYWQLMVRGVQAPDDIGRTEMRLAGVRTARWTTADLSSPVPLQVDGEATTARHATLIVQARAVRAIGAAETSLS
jgi:diacylglycerol kinase (ATP)